MAGDVAQFDVARVLQSRRHHRLNCLFFLDERRFAITTRADTVLLLEQMTRQASVAKLILNLWITGDTTRFCLASEREYIVPMRQKHGYREKRDCPQSFTCRIVRRIAIVGMSRILSPSPHGSISGWSIRSCADTFQADDRAVCDVKLALQGVEASTWPVPQSVVDASGTSHTAAIAPPDEQKQIAGPRLGVQKQFLWVKKAIAT